MMCGCHASRRHTYCKSCQSRQCLRKFRLSEAEFRGGKNETRRVVSEDGRRFQQRNELRLLYERELGTEIILFLR